MIVVRISRTRSIGFDSVAGRHVVFNLETAVLHMGGVGMKRAILRSCRIAREYCTTSVSGRRVSPVR